MKRPLFFLFLLTVVGIVFFYPLHYVPDSIFSQGLYYPVTVRGRLQSYQSQSNGLSLTLTDCQIQHKEQQYQCAQLLVTLEDDLVVPLQAGNQLLVEGSLSSFSPARNPGNFDWYGYYRSRHISYRVYAEEIFITDPQIAPLRQTLLSLRDSLTHRLHQLCGSDTETAALLTALLLGDKTFLEEDTKQQYQDGGILHILTVSGLHVILLGSAVILLGKKFHLSPWLRGLLSSLLILLYWQLCGGGMSAGRATVMFLCLTAAPLLGRTYDSLSALSLAGIWLLWDSPTLLYQAGFQLSFGAVLGIQLVCPAFVTKKCDPIKQTPAPSSTTPPTAGSSTLDFSAMVSFNSSIATRLSKILSEFRFSIGLQLTLLPVTIYHFFRYPLYSLLLNLLILPLTSPLFLLGASGLLLAEWLPVWGAHVATWLLLPCRWILDAYELLCQMTLSLPHASVLTGRPSTLRIIAYYGLLGLYCLRRYRAGEQTHKHTHGLLHCSASTVSQISKIPTPVTTFSHLFSVPLSTIALVALLLLPVPTAALSVTFLDVGQGDGAFLQTPAGTTILIDSGSSDVRQMADYRLIPFLESRGVDHLDYVFLSHTDEDHLNGVTDWLETGGTIGTAILPDLPDHLASSPSYQQLITLLTSYEIPIHFFSQGMSWQEGDLTLECLAPVAPTDSRSLLYQDLNTASQVLMLHYQGIRILFTGDCEKEGETLLLNYLEQQNLTCHILKAGHHGSTYATSQALLTQLTPQAVIISCGVRNRYGHPHPTMLARVEEANASCHVTASCGAVMVTVRGGKARLKTFLPAGPLYYR